MKAWLKSLGMLLGVLSIGTLTSCSDEWEGAEDVSKEMNRISLSGEIEQVAISRVNDSGFCDGDVMGVYIVDYQGSEPGELQNNGNRGNNVRHSFDESTQKWNSAYDVYWKDKTTHIDVYGYYAGAGERQDILDKLEEYRDKMSTQRLSQIIVAANEEEKRRNEDADKEYEDTIKSANTLYKDLGIIDKKRYDEIVKNAKAERDKKYQEAHDSREEIVREAEKMAGEIADTVDLETGEIYSPWELMWNEMEGSARNAINSVLGFIESLNNWVFKVFNKIADFGEKLTGKKMMDFAELKIPRLATGAVIPGGREFLAVLGDQPAGQTNVEAPLATIKQAVAETLQELGGVSGQPITVEIDGREVFVAVKNAERRYGSQLIGGAY